MLDNELTKGKKQWWFPVWAGLVIDGQATHWHKMGKAVWLYLYLIAWADRKTGIFRRSYKVICREMGMPLSTIRSWFTVLKSEGYIDVKATGRTQLIHINRFKTHPRKNR